MLRTCSTKDLLKYYVFDSRDEMGEKAAKDIASKILECLKKSEEVNIVFAAAPSQNEVLERLSTDIAIPWERVNAFHMDEYIGLPDDAPQKFGTFLSNAIFSKAKFKSVHYINGNTTDIQSECDRYSQLLKEYPTDIVCLGIGENGHIAFNDPWVADFHDSALVKTVSLDEMCRKQQVNDGCFASIDDVPKTAITLTIPALIKAKYMFCTVPAETKRAAVNSTINSIISTDCPATILRNHPNAVLYCDICSGRDLV